jgi:hypothetical protein
MQKIPDNLHLGNNKLNGSILGTLGGLTNLETFNISENNLQLQRH